MNMIQTNIFMFRTYEEFLQGNSLCVREFHPTSVLKRECRWGTSVALECANAPPHLEKILSIYREIFELRILIFESQILIPASNCLEKF